MRRLQLVLLADALAALVVLIGILPSGVRIACLAVMAACAWATEPERELPGGGWWALLAAGTTLSLTGFAAAELWQGGETATGLVAAAGSAITIVAAAIGFPLSPRPAP